jgi:hypothetical protein
MSATTEVDSPGASWALRMPAETHPHDTRGAPRVIVWELVFLTGK